MKIKFLGHASFLITSDSGIRIITDPYTPGQDLTYGNIKETADIVTKSHDHPDHSNVSAIQGNPRIIATAGKTTVEGIEVNGISAYHDENKGKARGNNTVFCLMVDGMRICHLGDLGHKLDNKQVAEIGKVDILLMPVGGFFTIDARTASEVYRQINPRVVIPMHYRNEKCKFPITGVDEFLKDKKNVIRKDTSEAEFKSDKLPQDAQIVVLKPAL